MKLVWALKKLSWNFNIDCHVPVFMLFQRAVRQSRKPELDGFLCVCKWLPGGFSSPATPRRIYSKIMGLPFDPRGCVQQESTSFFLFLNSVTAPSLPQSIHPSTDCTKNNGLFSCASAPLRGLWLGSAVGLRFQPHVLHSNQKSQAWQHGRIAEGDTGRKSTTRGENREEEWEKEG